MIPAEARSQLRVIEERTTPLELLCLWSNLAHNFNKKREPVLTYFVTNLPFPPEAMANITAKFIASRVASGVLYKEQRHSHVMEGEPSTHRQEGVLCVFRGKGTTCCTVKSVLHTRKHSSRSGSSRGILRTTCSWKASFLSVVVVASIPDLLESIVLRVSVRVVSSPGARHAEIDSDPCT